MSVTMTKTEGVTILTMNSDPQSQWPPLCQILKNLCYSPVCCSVSQHLRMAQKSCLSVLGTIQIMVGLLNIGLGVILSVIPTYSWQLYTGFPYWLGALFIVFGITCILSERFSSPCLVILNVILNLAGVIFAIAAIVLYSINIANMHLWYSCYNNYPYYRWGTSPTKDPQEVNLQQKCLEGKEMLLILLRSISAVLIILSVLELCVIISSVVLGIKALRSTEKEPEKSS